MLRRAKTRVCCGTCRRILDLGGGGRFRRDVAAQAERVGSGAHGFDAEGDMIVERDAEFFGAFDDILTADASRKRFVLHPFFHRACFQIENALGRPNIRTGGDEAGEFVAREKRVLERRLPRDIAVIGVGKNGADDFFGVAAFAKDFRALSRMLAVGEVVTVRPSLVVKVVKQGGESPGFFIGAILASIGADAGFHGEHMLAERF